MRLDAVVLSTQHDENVSQEQIHKDIKAYVFDEILPKHMVDGQTKFFINPTGRFVIEDLTATAVLQAVRSSWIPMAAMPVTAAVRSPERTVQRSTVPQPMLPDMWRKTCSRRNRGQV